MNQNNTLTDKINMSKQSMMMTFKCSNRFKIVFDHLRLNCNAVNNVLLCKNCVKYQYASRAVCSYANVFRNWPGCALIGAVALIRTNTVFVLMKLNSMRMKVELPFLRQGREFL